MKRFWIFAVSLVLSLLVVNRDPLFVGLAFDRDRIKQAEFFPFSSFPMYSGFSPRPFVVYVADGEGKPFAANHDFLVRTSILKKDYERRLKAIKKETGVSLEDLTPEEKRPAGEATLHHLVDTLASQVPPGPIQLWEIILTRDAGKIIRSPMMVAEIKRSSQETPLP